MNRRHLSFVVGVVEQGSFSEAARMCHATQPTLSAGIRQVEDYLGMALFERTTRHVMPTAFCRSILPAIKDVIASEKALELQAKAFLQPQNKLICIGVSPIVELSKIVAFMKPFRDQNPDIEIIYKERFIDTMKHRLFTDQIDLAILPDATALNPEFDSVMIYQDPWVFLPNATFESQTMSGPWQICEIAKQSLILTSGYCGLFQATQSLLGKQRLRLDIYPSRAMSYTAVEEWADLGFGSALLPASKISRGRQNEVYPVIDQDSKTAMLTLVACWRRQRSMLPFLSDFITYTQKHQGMS